GCISEEDLNLLRVSDEPETVVEIVQTWYMKHQIVGRRAMAR
ncbi:MAG: TIGR00730 family Rossman fold protein, partial [Chloroflexi bacterium]